MSANPIRSPGAFDVFRVNGIPCPGIPKVTGCVDESKLDVRNGTGASGATVAFQGKEPKSFKVQFHLMTEDDYDEWMDGPVRQIIMAPPEGTNAKSYTVDHPKPAAVNITAVITKSCAAPEEVGDGSYMVEVEMQPTPPPKPASGVPEGSTTSPDQPAAKDAADTEIENLTKQAQDLAK